MKANSTKPKKENLPEPALESRPTEPQQTIEGALPDAPLILQEFGCPPRIRQSELLAYANARLCFLIARADYEQKRSALMLKLVQGCTPEPGEHIARLENEGEKLVVLSHCQCCHSSTDIYHQCEPCETWKE